MPVEVDPIASIQLQFRTLAAQVRELQRQASGIAATAGAVADVLEGVDVLEIIMSKATDLVGALVQRTRDLKTELDAQVDNVVDQPTLDAVQAALDATAPTAPPPTP